MRRTLLTGRTGLLGRAIAKELDRAPDVQVLGTGFHRARDGIVRLDLTDQAAVNKLIDDIRPDVIVHAAAERRPDTCENDHDATRALNVEATGSIVESAEKIGARVLYVSTDYVFDGTAPPYLPEARPNPLNFYGRSKLEGEEVVRAGKGHSVLRVPVLYGEVESLDESPVTLIAEGLLQDGPKKLDHWATRYPTLTDDVAATCRQLLERQATSPDLHGTFHFSGDEPMTKYDMALVICEVWGLPTDDLLADAQAPAGAPRPENSQLDCGRLEKLGIGARTPFRQAIVRCLQPFSPPAAR